MTRFILSAAIAVGALAGSASVRETAAQTVTRGPYLTTATTNSVVVRWRTNIATDSRVQYGAAVGGLSNIHDDLAVTTEHEVKLINLTADTQYFYSIGSTTATLVGDDVDHLFRTHPMPGTPKKTRVWVIGDSGLGNQNARDVRDAYLAHPGSAETHVWLMLGDNAYNTGTDAQYQTAVFDTYPQLLRNTVVWPTRGNHDQLHSGTNNDYYEIFTLPTAGEAGGLASADEAYYSFDFANVHFVCLDSQGSNRTPAGAMLTWLVQDLAATMQDWVIAYWHHPPYSKGSHNSDIESQLIDMRENALPILEAGGVDLVLGGHSHCYERSFLVDEHYDVSTTLHDSMKVDTGDGNINGTGAYVKPTFGLAPHEGTVYAVAGSSALATGGPLDHPIMITSLNELGSLVLDIDGFQLDGTFIDETGAIRDEFTIVKGVATGIGDGIAVRGPKFSPNFPNPFTNQTHIPFSLSESGHVQLTIYDVKGRRVQTLVDSDVVRGDHISVWSGLNGSGAQVAPGIYFSVLEFDGHKRTRKIVLVR